MRTQNMWCPSATSEPEHLQVCKIKISKTLVKTQMDGKVPFKFQNVCIFSSPSSLQVLFAYVYATRRQSIHVKQKENITTSMRHGYYCIICHEICNNIRFIFIKT